MDGTKRTGELRLRPVTLRDGERLLAWRNDEETRRRSHSTDPVEPGDHLDWLARTLDDDGCRLYIAEEAGQPVGTARAQRDEKGVWELSWTVAPEARGRGVGSRMVTLLANQIREAIRAEMKSDHPASARIAQRAGMTYDYTEQGVAHYSRPALERAHPAPPPSTPDPGRNPESSQ